MITSKKSKITISVILTTGLFHLAAVFLGSWFHFHPDEDDHHKSNSYHAHIEPFPLYNHIFDKHDDESANGGFHQISTAPDFLDPLHIDLLPLKKHNYYKKCQYPKPIFSLPLKNAIQLLLYFDFIDLPVVPSGVKYAQFSTNLSPPFN